MPSLHIYEVILLLRAVHAEAQISGVHFLHSPETERQENQARFCLRAGPCDPLPDGSKFLFLPANQLVNFYLFLLLD
jgi:hypothetical protein